MPARFSAYPPDRAVVVRVFDDRAVYRIGRSGDCEVQLDHGSVSRMHAEIVHGRDSWQLTDTGSKNGLRVDGRLVLSASLAKPTWFAIGDVYCWLEPLSVEAANQAVALGEVRRSTSRALSQQLSRATSIDPLLQQTLDAVLELSQMERGFVLYGQSVDDLRVRARHGIRREDLSARGFSGSAGSLERSFASRRSVICCDTSDSPWLGARPSVVMGGIRALICVPLLLGEDVLGAVYADSRQQGPLLTELDVELIEGVAQHAAAALAAARLRGALDELLDAASEAGVEAPRWSELRPR